MMRGSSNDNEKRPLAVAQGGFGRLGVPRRLCCGIDQATKVSPVDVYCVDRRRVEVRRWISNQNAGTREHASHVSAALGATSHRVISDPDDVNKKL